jgi:HlyD family secretion protein
MLGTAAIAVPLFLLLRGHKSTPAASVPIPKPVTSVACVGRIEPVDGVTRVSAPNINGHASLVAELHVKEGDEVRKGRVLAVLDGRPQLESAVRQGEARIALALTRIEQAKAGPKASDVAAQKEAIARLQASYEHSQAEYLRYEGLHRKRDVSTSDLDSKRAEMENDSHLREEALARLKSLSEIRPEDVRIYESELAVARTELDRLHAELESTVVHSPSAGKVLHIRAHEGEEVGPLGLIEMAKTDSMCVIAEVYETDLGRIRVGQKADITSELLPRKLQGTVSAIGSEIGRAELSSPDPATFADSRVVNVRIRLEDSSAIAGLIHGKVIVVIEP